MGGRLRGSSGLGQDRTGKWREVCREIASELNYDDNEVWTLWKQIALVREYACPVALHRDIHEDQAHRDVKEILDSRGRAPS